MHSILIVILVGLLGLGCASITTAGTPSAGDGAAQKPTGGIVWFRTAKLDEIIDFYTRVMGCTLWLDQNNCKVLQHGNLLLGFCSAEEPDLDALPCFFYREKSTVDQMYQKLSGTAEFSPRDNSRYQIYHFFARDPENRRIECQHFNHELLPY